MKQRKRNQGFTLIELTAALFVVTAGIFGAIQLHLMSMDATRVLNEYAIASRVLNGQMEAIRALPTDALVSGQAQKFQNPSPEMEKLMNASGAVDIHATAELPGLYEVHVRLAWTGQHGRRIEKELVSFIASREAVP